MQHKSRRENTPSLAGHGSVRVPISTHRHPFIKPMCGTSLMIVVPLILASMGIFVSLSMPANHILGESSNNAPWEQRLISNKLARSMQNNPIGSLGPTGTKRQNYRYYDSLYYTSLQFGGDATSGIEVGCASDPFLKYLDWIDKRTCVAPYFVDYPKIDFRRQGTDGVNHSSVEGGIERVTADFMRYQLPNEKKYDLLVCGQVLEHVPDPASFLRKLISTAKTSIISVPYDWTDCGKSCNHVTHHITYETILEWSKPHVPIYETVVAERGKSNHKYGRRMIVVFKANRGE